MPTRLFIACTLVWLGGLAFLPIAGCRAAAQQQRGNTINHTTGQEVILYAETLEYARGEKRLVATGKVSIVHGKTRLFADHVEIDTASGVGSAWGHVRLLTPEDDIEAARLDFELTSERGVLYDGAGVVAKSYVVTGGRIEYLGPRSFLLQHGRVTTCTNAVPDWEFRAREAHLGEGKYVTLQHPSFWIKGVPVFYVPYLILPLQEERTTGFLPPHIGGSRRDGAIVGTEFFWAMTDWMDTTVGLEYLSKKGWRPEGAFRYAIDPLSDGQLEGSFIHEQDTGRERWKIALRQRQEFGWGLRGLSQLDLRSSRDLDRRFARDLALESVVQTASFGTLTKRFADGTLALAAETFEAIPESGSEQAFRRLPSLRFEQFPTSIFGMAFFAVEASYSRLSATEVLSNTPTQRLDFFPHLMFPVTLPPWMRLTFSGGVRETFYDHQTTGRADVSRALLDLRAYLQGPTLRRRYAGPQGRWAFVHVMESRVAYRYVPQVSQNDVPPFETLNETQHFLDPLETVTLVDRIAAANYLKLSLIHRLFARGLTNPQRPTMREVARLVVSQGLDTRASEDHDGQLVGPLDLELEMRFWQRLWLTSTLRIEVAAGNVQESNWRLGFMIRPGWLVHVASRYRQSPDIQYVSGGLQVTLREGLQVGYDWRYDGRLAAFREHQATLHYQRQCWGLDMRFRWRESGDTELSIRANLLYF